MAVTVGDILRVAVRHKWENVDDIVNVLHFGVATAPTPNDEASLLEDVSEMIGDAWLNIEAHLCNNVSAYDIAVWNVSDDAPVGATSFGAGYAGGTSGGECMPAAAAALVLLNTSVKRTQGRIYLAAFSEGDQVDGEWQGSLIADIGGLVDALRFPGATPNGTVLQYGVLKRSDGLLYQTNTVRVQPIIAYQLRRKPGRGS